MLAVEMKHLFIIDIGYHIAAGKQQISALAGLHIAQVFVITVNIPFLGIPDFFFLVHGQIIQAMLLTGQIPFFCRTHMIQHGTGMERQNQADGINSRIDHIAQRKVHETELGTKGFGSQRPFFTQFFHRIGAL